MSEPIKFATVADIEARWRPLTDDEKTTANALLDDAADLILSECPLTEEQQEAKQATLKRVSVAVVKRAMSSPVGIGVESIQQGAGSYQGSVKFSNPAGDLYLTRAERRALGCGRQKAFTIDLCGGGL